MTSRRASREAAGSRIRYGQPYAGQRFGICVPHSAPVQGAAETSVILALPLLSRVSRKLVHAVLLVVSVSRNALTGWSWTSLPAES